MASIIGLLRDKRGNVLQGIDIISRIASNPSGDTATTITDSIGFYSMTVSNSGTLYDIYVNTEAGGVNGPNWCGKAISSGDVVSSFNLAADSTFLTEHKANGKHDDITVDTVLLNTNGYIKSTDSFFESKQGSDNARFRVTNSSSVYWINPYPIAGSDNQHSGLIEGYDVSVRNFYLGAAKTYKVSTDGSFVLGAGTFSGAVDFNNDIAFNKNVVFDKDYKPSYDTYEAPTDDRELASKKYVDDSVSVAALISNSFFKDPVKCLKMVDDSDGSGAPPAASSGDTFIATNFGGGFTEGNMYEHNGTTWDDLGGVVAGTKIIVTDTSAAGSFTGEENSYGIYDGTAWTFFAPEDGWTVLIRNIGGVDEDFLMSYDADSSEWKQIN